MIGQQRTRIHKELAVHGITFCGATTALTTAGRSIKKYRSQMGQPVAYSEHDFINLPVADIDAHAREAKKVYDLYQRYSSAMAQLQLEAISKQEFCALGDNQGTQTERAEDAAKKWPEYTENMKHLGQPVKAAREFLALSADERANLYQVSRGTSRSTWQFLRRNYSASDGWATYRDSLNALGLPLRYSEYEFINLTASEIDKLATHAKQSKEAYSKLKTLCDLAVKPFSYSAGDIYGTDDVSQWSKEYDNRQKEWASRILYADSCKRVGASPNWGVFESKTVQEQFEAAATADAIAKNVTEYRALCEKLERTPDVGFLNESVASQQQMVTQLSDELWSQRKQVIKEVGIEVGVVIAAILVKKAIDDWNGPASNAADTAGHSSRIDRDAFARQRHQYWKNEAQSNLGKYSPENVERMSQGEPPIGDDGFPMELHHPGGDPNAAPIPMTRTDHRLGDNFSKNHPWLFEKKE